MFICLVFGFVQVNLTQSCLQLDLVGQLHRFSDFKFKQHDVSLIQDHCTQNALHESLHHASGYYHCMQNAPYILHLTYKFRCTNFSIVCPSVSEIIGFSR